MANGFGNGGFGRTTEPEANRWHDLKLGSSFKNQKSKFCTLRYEFKPASIDKTQPGSLHKSKENRVTVEFHNNQPGKPKVSFEGSSEEYKELEGVLFFDGEEFKLEKLNRAFKSLKHKRVPGESNLTSTGTSTNGESHSPPLTKVARTQNINRPSTHAVPVEMERIDIGEPENTGTRPTTNKPTNSSYQYQPTNTNTNPDPFSPSSSNQDQDSPLDILGNSKSSPPIPAVGFDINVPTNQDFDDEINIAFDDDLDNNDEGGMSAAQALMRAQQQEEGNGDVQLENREREAETSSSGGGSSSSGSSSGSGSGSSSETDAADSASSGDVDVF
ncbi:hypothetical protein LUZ60_001056 [Juncus effusus]|nr:hypothetical protein LUZ60_001056 [Juncus effusus]